MLRPQRDSLENVRPPPYAAVDRNLETALLGDGRVVELAAAVVGDYDAVDRVRDGELDVGWVQDWNVGSRKK